MAEVFMGMSGVTGVGVTGALWGAFNRLKNILRWTTKQDRRREQC